MSSPNQWSSTGPTPASFAERLEGLQGLWQEKGSASKLWMVEGTWAVKYQWKKDCDRLVPTGFRSTISEGMQGEVVWGKGFIFLDPTCNPKDGVACWRQRVSVKYVGKVAFAWKFRGPAPDFSNWLWTPDGQKSTEDSRSSEGSSPKALTPQPEGDLNFAEQFLAGAEGDLNLAGGAAAAAAEEVASDEMRQIGFAEDKRSTVEGFKKRNKIPLAARREVSAGQAGPLQRFDEDAFLDEHALNDSRTAASLAFGLASSCGLSSQPAALGGERTQRSPPLPFGAAFQ